MFRRFSHGEPFDEFQFVTTSIKPRARSRRSRAQTRRVSSADSAVRSRGVVAGDLIAARSFRPHGVDYSVATGAAEVNPTFGARP